MRILILFNFHVTKFSSSSLPLGYIKKFKNKNKTLEGTSNGW